MNNQELLKKIISHSKEYGFVYPSSEIYDGLSAVYDYGPYGSLLKNNIKEFWWKSMVQLNDNIVGIDSSILIKAEGPTKETAEKEAMKICINKSIQSSFKDACYVHYSGVEPQY